MTDVEAPARRGKEARMTRERFYWLVELQAQTGQVIQRVISSFWSPSWKGGTAEGMGTAAAIQAKMTDGRGQVDFVVIGKPRQITEVEAAEFASAAAAG